MEYREFTESTDPLEQDYDVTSGIKEDGVNYYDELMELVGILEDITDEELYDAYGITMQEYINPTAETIEKVKAKLAEQPTVAHKL